ncbi:hypothetical protein [Colwellia hornerae]|uniref:Uncharacterized protein n=1 Tax=Colwellia hornerae TaxID=89402 RepID=A0A5C6QEN8_9GAMM|nr:hypothetical protein [Colwellia hornerae]TWX52274.1 hypothetical protein ESZ28_12785 [Colwellia hornerae]TWX57833.1 hypothetical protein ESZ26_12750 [Colwellia hornerae]TWX67535.1 hypothetical protein ESZ27_08620 [Colwellia hornerae]
MWRTFSITLFLFVLAATANALPIENSADSHLTFSSISTLGKIDSHTPSNVTVLIDNIAPDDVAKLPRLNRVCASLFINEIQTTPNYLLVTEFFPLKLSASLFKNLANPPVQLNWFEQLSHRSNSNRLAGWKDGNTLYKARLTYHS